MYMMRHNVLCDVDHTIADAFWRDELIGGPGGWDAYHSASINDLPLNEMVMMISALRNSGMYIVGLTARPEKWRKLTLDWMIKHGVQFDELIMRPDDNYDKAHELKIKLAQERFPDLANEVAFLIDDQEDIITAFKGLGVPALQVHGISRGMK